MRYSVDVFSKTYRDKQFHEPVLVVGKQFSLSRQDMYTNLANGHTVAAKRVSAVLKRLKIATVRDILTVPLVDWARINGFGEASLRILLDLLDADGVAVTDMNLWMKSSLQGQKLVQWESIVRQAAKTGKKRGTHDV